MVEAGNGGDAQGQKLEGILEVTDSSFVESVLTLVFRSPSPHLEMSWLNSIYFSINRHPPLYEVEVKVASLTAGLHTHAPE